MKSKQILFNSIPAHFFKFFPTHPVFESKTITVTTLKHTN